MNERNRPILDSLIMAAVVLIGLTALFYVVGMVDQRYQERQEISRP